MSDELKVGYGRFDPNPQPLTPGQSKILDALKALPLATFAERREAEIANLRAELSAMTNSRDDLLLEARLINATNDDLRATITRLTAELDEMHMRATVAEGMQRLNAAERDRMGTALSQLIAYAETSDNAQYFTLSAALVEEIARAALQEPK